MKAAVLSDVHGNLLALDAVLADAARAGVAEIWVVGDLVAHGPHPGGTIRRLMSLKNATFVRGNRDRYVLTSDLPDLVPNVEIAGSAADVRLLVDASCSFAWTRGAITDAGGYDWLASLPVEQRLNLPDGTRVLLVHASPGRDDGPEVQESMTDHQLVEQGLSEAEADLVFVGHTHLPLDRAVEGVRIVHLGSVSVPATTERRAMWTLLVADPSGFTIERRFADYDIEAVIRQLHDQHFPSAGWLTAKLRRTAL